MSSICENALGVPSDPEIEAVLNNASSIAIVGISSDPDRPSYRVASYLKEQGFKIIPVNPSLTEVLGERAYGALDEIDVHIDIIDVFRRSEAVDEVVTQLELFKARTGNTPALWLQEGVINLTAAERAVKLGAVVVMDRCILKEHARLIG